MQNNTNDFLTKLDLIEKYPQLFSTNEKKKIELTKDEIEVLRAMIIEHDGKRFAQRNINRGKELMNKQVKK